MGGSAECMSVCTLGIQATSYANNENFLTAVLIFEVISMFFAGISCVIYWPMIKLKLGFDVVIWITNFYVNISHKERIVSLQR